MANEKAQHDEASPKALLDDPRAAVQQESSLPLPSSMKFTVLEQSSMNMGLELSVRSTQSGELTDAELEGVSGAGVSGVDSGR